MALVSVYLRVLYIVYRTQNTRQRQNRVGNKTIKTSNSYFRFKEMLPKSLLKCFFGSD